MDAPANLPELVSEFAAITGASPLVADHYLSACNYDLNRSIEFYFEHPPAPSQAGPRAGSAIDEDVAAMAAHGQEADIAGRTFARGGPDLAGPEAADDDEELQRALAASMAEAGAGPRHGGPGLGGSRPAGRSAQRRDEDVQVIDDEEEDEEELPGAEELLEALARQGEASRAADREAREQMEEVMDRMLAGLTGRSAGALGMPPPGYPPASTAADPLLGIPSIFPGMSPLLQPPLGFPVFPGGPAGRVGQWRDEGGGGGGGGGRGSRSQEGGARARDGSGGGGPGGAGQAQRRRIEVRQEGARGGGGGGGGGGATAGVSGRGERGGIVIDEDELELPEGISRHELEEARMMEAALLGVPYEGRALHDLATGFRAGGGGLDEREVAPELLEHRELRWDQDRAYEESLAADRAKEQAAARAKAEAEARERAQREAEAAAERAAAAEAARLAALVAAKTSRLPAEPPSSSADAITVMVRLPDGSRHSRRFARTDQLSSLFDFVDVELDATAKATAAAAGDGGGAAAASSAVPPPPSLKPGSYNLVAQFPRRVFSDEENGGKTFEEAGLAGGGGAAFFIELKNG